MIVITTPAGTIGHQVLEDFLGSGEQLRLVARDLSGISADMPQGIEVVEGSHGDSAVVEKAFTPRAAGPEGTRAGRAGLRSSSTRNGCDCRRTDGGGSGGTRTKG